MNDLTLIPTGIPKLDKIIGCFRSSRLIVLAAGFSMGKTAFALDLARSFAIDRNIPVLYFSLEESAQEIIQRLIVAIGKVDSWDLRQMTPEERRTCAQVAETQSRIESAPLFIEDKQRNISDICAKARRFKERYPNLGLIIVDDLQKFSRDIPVETRAGEISKISGILKNLAQDLEVPVLALAQLSSLMLSQAKRKPILSDLNMWSGTIEQHADMVIFIYRFIHENCLVDTKTEIIVAKSIDGPTGVAAMQFIEKYLSFTV